MAKTYQQIYQGLFSPEAERRRKEKAAAYQRVRDEQLRAGLSPQQRVEARQAKLTAEKINLGTDASNLTLEKFLKGESPLVDPVTGMIHLSSEIKAYAKKTLGVDGERLEQLANYRLGKYREQQETYLGRLGRPGIPESMGGGAKLDLNKPEDRLKRAKEGLFNQVTRNLASATTPAQQQAILRTVFGTGPGAQQLAREYGDFTTYGRQAAERRGEPDDLLEKADAARKLVADKIASVYAKVPQPAQNAFGNVLRGVMAPQEAVATAYGVAIGAKDASGKRLDKGDIADALQNVLRGIGQAATFGQAEDFPGLSEKAKAALEYEPLKGVTFKQLATTKEQTPFAKATRLSVPGMLLELTGKAATSKNRAARDIANVTGFAGDVILDPLTYLTLGAGRIGKGAVDLAGEVAERAAFRHALGESVESATKTRTRGLTLEELSAEAGKRGVDTDAIQAAIQRAAAVRLEAMNAYGRRGIKGLRDLLDDELGKGATSKLLPRLSRGGAETYLADLRGGASLRLGVGPAKIGLNVKEGSPRLREALRAVKYGPDFTLQRFEGTGVPTTRLGRAYDKAFELFSPGSIVSDTEGVNRAALSRETRKRLPGVARDVFDIQTGGEGLRRSLLEPALEKGTLAQRVLDKAFKKGDPKRGSKIVELIEDGPNSPHYAAAAKAVGGNAKLDEALERMRTGLDEIRAGVEAEGVRVPTLKELEDIAEGDPEHFFYFPHRAQIREIAESAGLALPQVVAPARRRVLAKGTSLTDLSGQRGAVLPSGRFADVQKLTEKLYGVGALSADPFIQYRTYAATLAHAAKNVRLYREVGRRGYGFDLSEQALKEMQNLPVLGPEQLAQFLGRTRSEIQERGLAATEAGQAAAKAAQEAEQALQRNAEELAERRVLLDELGTRRTVTRGLVKLQTRSAKEKRELEQLAAQDYRAKRRELERTYRTSRAELIRQTKAEIRAAQADQSELVSRVGRLDKTHQRNLQAVERTYRRQLDGIAATPAKVEGAVLAELRELGQEMRRKKAGLTGPSGRTMTEIQADIAEAELRLAQIGRSKLAPTEVNVVARVTKALNKASAYDQAKLRRDELVEAMEQLDLEERALESEMRQLRSQANLRRGKRAGERDDQAVAAKQAELDTVAAQRAQIRAEGAQLADVIANPPNFFERHKEILAALSDEERSSELGSLFRDLRGKEAFERVQQAARERAAATYPVKARVRRAQAKAQPEPAALEPELPIPPEPEIAATLGPEAARAGRELRAGALEQRIQSPDQLLAAQREVASLASDLRADLERAQANTEAAEILTKQEPNKQNRQAVTASKAAEARLAERIGELEREGERLAREVYKQTVILPIQRASRVLTAEDAAQRLAVTQARNERLALSEARTRAVQTREGVETNKRLNRLRAQNLREFLDQSMEEMNAVLGGTPERRRMAFLNNVLGGLSPSTADMMGAAALHTYLQQQGDMAARVVQEWERIAGGIEQGYRRALREADTQHMDAMIAEWDAAQRLAEQEARDIAGEAEAAAVLTREADDLNYFRDDLSADLAALDSMRRNHRILSRGVNAQQLAIAQLQKMRPQLRESLSRAQGNMEEAHAEFFDAAEASLKHGLAEAMAPNLAELQWVSQELPYVKGGMALPQDIAAAIKNASDPGAPSRFAVNVGRYSTFFKRGTLLSLGSTNRRIFGNIYNATMYEGVTPREITLGVRALVALKKVGGDVTKVRDPKLARYLRYATEQNIFEGKQVQQIASRAEQFQHGVRHLIQTTEKANFILAANAEDAVRLAAFIRALDKGLGPQSARQLVGKYHFFNHELTPFERNVARNVFPFYAYLKNNTALQIYNLFHRPGMLSKTALLQQNVAAVERDPFAPRYVTETGGFALPLYRTQGSGNLLGRLFPYSTNPNAGPQEMIFNNLLDTGVLAIPSQAARTIPDALRGDLAGSELLGSATPLISGLAGFLANQNLYTGRQFSERPENYLGLQVSPRIASTVRSLFPLLRHAERFAGTSDYTQETYGEGLLGELSGVTIRPSTVSSQASEAARRGGEASELNKAIAKVLAREGKTLLETDKIDQYEREQRKTEELRKLFGGDFDVQKLQAALKKASLAASKQEESPPEETGGDWKSDLSAAEYELLRLESGLNPTADNPTSTAFGIWQGLESTRKAYLGADWETTDPRKQKRAFRRYVRDRYGNAENALQFWYANHWY